MRLPRVLGWGAGGSPRCVTHRWLLGLGVHTDMRCSRGREALRRGMCRGARITNSARAHGSRLPLAAAVADAPRPPNMRQINEGFEVVGCCQCGPRFAANVDQDASLFPL